MVLKHFLGGSGLMLSFVGCLIDGYLMDKYGRKSLLYLTFAIHFIGWMVIAKTEYFIFGRFLTGLALGKYKFEINTAHKQIIITSNKYIIIFPTIS